jgi:hypothetical protein
MTWWITNIDAVLLLIFGVLFSLMGAGIVKISKAAIQPPGGRLQRTREVMIVGGPLLVIFGLTRIAFDSTPSERWREIRGDGKFAIMLPSEPEVTEQVVDSTVGKVIAHRYKPHAEHNDVDYRIAYTDLPATASYENLPQPIHPDLAGLTKIDFKQTSQTTITVCGYPGAVVDGTGPNGLVLKLEFVWVGRRQYILMRSAKAGAVPSDDLFFSTFRVLAK